MLTVHIFLFHDKLTSNSCQLVVELVVLVVMIVHIFLFHDKLSFNGFQLVVELDVLLVMLIQLFLFHDKLSSNGCQLVVLLVQLSYELTFICDQLDVKVLLLLKLNH